MSPTTVLLRSLLGISGAEVVLVAVDGSSTIAAAYGLRPAECSAILAAVRAGRALPGERSIAAAIPMRLKRTARSAILYLVNGTAPAPPALATDVLEVFADEVAGQVDAAPATHAEAALVARLAVGIDALNDAAAIVESPAAAGAPRFLYVNHAFEMLLGFAAADTVGQPFDILCGPLTDRGRIEFMNERLSQSGAARISVVYYRVDGVPLWVEVSLRAVVATGETADCTVATLRDVSARKEFEYALAKEKRKLQVTLAAIGDAVITTVADGRIDYVNFAARTLLDIDAADAYGTPVADVLALHDASGAPVDVLHGAHETSDGYRGQAQRERGAGRQDVAYVSSPIGDEGFVVVLRDVTAQQRLSTRLSYEASHDPLTGIYNRRKFDQILNDAMLSARDGAPHTLALLDLDRFKNINDTCGHGVGDRVLRDVAALLREPLRERDVVARIGGDEFAVLLHDCSLDNAQRVFDALARAVEEYRVMHAGREYGVGVSIGITAIDGADVEASHILARADAACYAAKPAAHGRAR